MPLDSIKTRPTTALKSSMTRLRSSLSRSSINLIRKEKGQQVMKLWEMLPRFDNVKGDSIMDYGDVIQQVVDKTLEVFPESKECYSTIFKNNKNKDTGWTKENDIKLLHFMYDAISDCLLGMKNEYYKFEEDYPEKAAEKRAKEREENLARTRAEFLERQQLNRATPRSISGTNLYTDDDDDSAPSTLSLKGGRRHKKRTVRKTRKRTRRNKVSKRHRSKKRTTNVKSVTKHRRY